MKTDVCCDLPKRGLSLQFCQSLNIVGNNTSLLGALNKFIPVLSSLLNVLIANVMVCGAYAVIQYCLRYNSAFSFVSYTYARE